MQRNLLLRAHGPSSFGQGSAEKDRTRARTVDLDVTIRAVCVLRVQVVLRPGRLIRAHAVRGAVTSQTELRDAARNQQARIRRTVRRVTRDAALGLDGRVLVNKRTLLVRVTLDTCRVSTGRESCLFKFETAVWIVAVAALHRAFQHLVMERQIKLVLRLAVTTQAKLWLALAEQLQIRNAWLLRICFGDEYVRGGELSSRWRRMG